MFMGLGLILTIGVVAAVAYALGWRPSGQSRSYLSNNDNKSALDIAMERYARGEISKEEYAQIRHDLSN